MIFSKSLFWMIIIAHVHLSCTTSVSSKLYPLKLKNNSNAVSPEKTHYLASRKINRDHQGDVCIAPLTQKKYTGPNMLNTKFSRENCRQNLMVKIDDQSPVQINALDGAVVHGLSVLSQHTLKVFFEHKRIHAFKFRFKDTSWPKLTLRRKSGYCSWSLRPRKPQFAKCPWPKNYQ